MAQGDPPEAEIDRLAASQAGREVGFDAVLVRLREVVERLESGELSLEESLRVYEEGVAMARRGHQLLDRAEKRVEVLVSGNAGNGGLETSPLDDTEVP